MSQKTKEILEEIYQKLFKHFGHQYWWPAKTPFEVIIGSILTQNTAWSNVEKAIKNLKKEKVLSPAALKKIPLRRLAKLIRSSGYYNQKAKKIKNFINFLYSHYDGSLAKMFKKDYLELRSELLTIKGIGLETADSILLYAACKPIFVVDAYTKRILLRHNILSEDENYSAIQNIFMDSLRGDVQLFNEYHALLVKLGKSICKTKPNCLICPLNYLFEEKGYPPSQPPKASLATGGKTMDLPVIVHQIAEQFGEISPKIFDFWRKCEKNASADVAKGQAAKHLADNPPKFSFVKTSEKSRRSFNEGGPKAKVLRQAQHSSKYPERSRRTLWRRRVDIGTRGLPVGLHVCDSCNKTLTTKKAHYLAKIELYASPEIEFNDEDLRKDSKKELKSLIEELKKRDSEELEEDVYISYKFNLCKKCRDIFNQRLNNKEFV